MNLSSLYTRALNFEFLSVEEGVFLFHNAPLTELMFVADELRKKQVPHGTELTPTMDSNPKRHGYDSEETEDDKGTEENDENSEEENNENEEENIETDENDDEKLDPEKLIEADDPHSHHDYDEDIY